jgi:proteic killer suppression protein
VIESFGDRMTKDFYNSAKSSAARRVASNIKKRARIMLDLINFAANLNDLRSPPGNHLEELKGDLKGFHSVKINDQWRIVFRWQGNNAHDVRITDYH